MAKTAWGDIGLPLRGRTPASGHAVDALREQINAHAGDISLVTLGPLTNVALALLREPELAERVSHCYIMGGIGSGHGNVTPTAEFNIWVDPEAAKVVYDSGMAISMVGLGYILAVRHLLTLSKPPRSASWIPSSRDLSSIFKPP